MQKFVWMDDFGTITQDSEMHLDKIGRREGLMCEKPIGYLL